MTEQEIRRVLKELYTEEHELEEKLYHCLGNIEEFEARLKELTEQN